MANETFEPQYSIYFDTQKKFGNATLGLSSNNTWQLDSSRLTYMLSRYKFVSRMFKNYKNVLEIGCGDGFASKIVADQVANLHLCDIDPILIHDAKGRNANNNVDFTVKDYVAGFIDFKFDGIYALDVLEHINPNDEKSFITNIIKSLNNNGVVILGMPSLESQKYASETSKLGHVNCKSAPDFKLFLDIFFHNVFIFSMNDEVLHTGFFGMSHYILALATGPKFN
jgi:2-polyprenyl-3-methyl-5-hydroxy-6-metoxy-1,4-benzoquinol methylase